MFFDQSVYDKILAAEFWGPWVDVPNHCMTYPDEVQRDDIVQVVLHSATNQRPDRVWNWSWTVSVGLSGRIVKYRKLMEEWGEEIPWSGGSCPIPITVHDHNYFIRFRDGTIQKNFHFLGRSTHPHGWDWRHGSNPSGKDIIGYGFLVPPGSYQKVDTELDRFRKFFSSNPVM